MIGAAPWAIQPDTLEELLDRIARGPTVVTAPTPSDLTRSVLSTRPEQPYTSRGRTRIRDGVAIVPVTGPIFRDSNFLTNAGFGISLAVFAMDLTTADADPNVRAILIEANSPGGEISGLTGAADLVRSVASRKPIVVYVDGMLASGAYQIAAAARQIVASPTAVLGELGVVLTTTDRRRADAAAGIRRYEFVSSQTPGKRADPATDEGRAALQTLADRLADEFLADIAHSRGTTADALLAATDGGGLVIGRDAVTRGLADLIGGYDETVARLASGQVPPARRLGARVADLSKPTVPPMAIAPVAPPPPAPPVPHHSPVSLERDRVLAIHGAAAPGFQELATLAVASGWPLDVFQATQSALAAGADSIESLPTSLSHDARVTALWLGSAKTRTEFRGDRASFVAFNKAMANGKARVLAPRRHAGPNRPDRTPRG